MSFVTYRKKNLQHQHIMWLTHTIPLLANVISSLRIQFFNTAKKFLSHNKEETQTNNIHNIFSELMFQQFLAYKHHRLHDSMSGPGKVSYWSPQTKKNKPLVKQEPRSAVNNKMLLFHF